MVYLFFPPSPIGSVSDVVAYGSSGAAVRALLSATDVPLSRDEIHNLARLVRAGESVSVDGFAVLPLAIRRN